jgi:hypothetical protein
LIRLIKMLRGDEDDGGNEFSTFFFHFAGRGKVYLNKANN